LAASSTRDPIVLVVDGEASGRHALERTLRVEGFAVATAAGGRDAFDAIAERPPAAILLDGPALVPQLRERGVDVPVCIVSARDTITDRVAGLAAGADDYLVKPFAPAELKARLRALMRRANANGAELPVVVGALVIDARHFVATRDGRDLELTRREFDLLEAFARHPGQVLGREQLLDMVWGYATTVETNVVDVFIGYVRRKLGEPKLIETVRGVGWVLRA
jgi:DNA-binding response OmpR family regulator